MLVHGVTLAADGGQMARGVPRTRLGEPRVALLVVGTLTLAVVIATGGAAALAGGFLLGAAALVLVAGVLVVWGTWHRRRFRSRVAVQPFRTTGPEPSHEPMRPEVAALEAHGYVVEVFGRNAVDEALIILGHPDGSVATVASGRVLGRSRRVVAVSSRLDPGRQWLVTGPAVMTRLTEAFWADALPGAPSPDEAIRRHAATRAWFCEQGIVIHPVGRGLAADDVVARIRTAAAATGPWLGVTPMGDHPHRPLAEVPGVEDRLHALRQAQAAPGASAVPGMAPLAIQPRSR